jgi:hypothetical protein
MTIPTRLARELTTTSTPARSRLRSPTMTLGLLALLSTAVACGSIENSEDVADLGPGPTTTEGARNTPSPTQRTATPTARANDTDPTDVSANERENDDLIRSGSSTSRTRGGGAGRPRVSDIRSDAGDVDAGDVDAGEVDAGEVDAGVLEVDAGQAGDAGDTL